MNGSQPLPALDAGLVQRPLAGDDAQASLDLVNAISQADEGKTRYTLAQIRTSWNSPGFDISSDTWGALAATELAWVRPRYTTPILNTSGLSLSSGSIPRFRGTPIGRHLLAFLDERLKQVPARAADGLRVAAVTVLMSDPTPMTALLREWGWVEHRHYWTMAIDLPEPPPSADWPEGITVRMCTAEDAPILHDVEVEAFADHFGYEPEPFDVWHLGVTEYLGSSPDLWFLAESGAVPAGMCICALEQPDDPLAGIGYIGSLGVLRAFRGRG